MLLAPSSTTVEPVREELCATDKVETLFAQETKPASRVDRRVRPDNGRR